MKKLFHVACLAVLAFYSIGTAQERVSFDDVQDGEQAIANKYWVCIIGCPKSFITTVKLDTITSVSKHTYSVDGVAFREVTIDTRGNNSIRFYTCLNERVNTAKNRLSNTRALLDSKSGNISKIPAKKFPEGTYSHNVEYLIENCEDLNKLYESVVNALFKNKGCTFKIRTSS